MKSTNFKNAFELMKSAKTVAIVGHIRPDGDCVGCALALKIVLENMGKKIVDIFIDGQIPRQFYYLQGFDKIQTSMPECSQNYDLLIIVDSSSEDRIGVFTAMREFATNVLVFDHHIGTSVEGNCVVANSDMASCGEILYELFTQNKIKITPEIATALYTSISTDTGCFLYASTTAFTHRVAADLMELGVNIELANYYNFRLYEKRLISGLRQVLRNLHFKHG